MPCKIGTLANTPGMQAMCTAAVMCERADEEVAEVVDMAQTDMNFQHRQRSRRVDIEEVMSISASFRCNADLCNLDSANSSFPSSIPGIANIEID